MCARECACICVVCVGAVFVCVFMRVLVHMCVRARTRVCVRVCVCGGGVYVCACVFCMRVYVCVCVWNISSPCLPEHRLRLFIKMASEGRQKRVVGEGGKVPCLLISRLFED